MRISPLAIANSLRILLIPAFLALFLGVHAQEYSFTAFNLDQGMPHTQAMSVFQDRAGYLWVGTFGGGVAKFDGKNFRVMTKEDGLWSNQVCSILEDKEGNLWFGYNGLGVTKYDGKHFTFYGSRSGLEVNHRFTIEEDHAGSIWIASPSHGAYKLINEQFELQINSAGLPDSSVSHIYPGEDGTLWFATAHGLVGHDGNDYFRPSDSGALATVETNHIVPDPEGTLFLATDTGVVKFDGKKFSIVKETLPLGRIRNILLDNSGRLWVNSMNGLAILDGTQLTRFPDLEYFPAKKNYCLMQDKEGNVWIGTDGRGLYRFNGDLFVHYGEPSGWAHNRLFAINELPDGRLWLGTDAGLFELRENRFEPVEIAPGLTRPFVLNLSQDNQGNTWVCSIQGLFRYDGTKFEPYLGTEKFNRSLKTAVTQDRGRSALVLYFARLLPTGRRLHR